METSNAILSAPLQRLKDEHVLLRKDMNQFYDITEEIEFEAGSGVMQLFTELHEQIVSFNIKLKAHSIREEEGLFPIMERHLSDDDKTIETMEYEHEKAEQHLKDFLTQADQAESSLDENDAQLITVHAVQAYATLSQHFAKEENMLFPLAEKLLTDDEKKELEQLLEA